MFDILLTSKALYPPAGICSTHLETVLLWICTASGLIFPSYPIVLSFLSFKTCHPVLVKYQDSTSRQAVNKYTTLLESKQACRKHNGPDMDNCSLPVFNRRVGNISAGQARNTYRQAMNIKPTRGLHNRQDGNCVGQAGFNFTACLLMKSLSIQGDLVCTIHHLESGI